MEKLLQLLVVVAIAWLGWQFLANLLVVGRGPDCSISSTRTPGRARCLSELHPNWLPTAPKSQAAEPEFAVANTNIEDHVPTQLSTPEDCSLEGRQSFTPASVRQAFLIPDSPIRRSDGGCLVPVRPHCRT